MTETSARKLVWITPWTPFNATSTGRMSGDPKGSAGSEIRQGPTPAPSRSMSTICRRRRTSGGEVSRHLKTDAGRGNDEV
jgi:hypothetical protein